MLRNLIVAGSIWTCLTALAAGQTPNTRRLGPGEVGPPAEPSDLNWLAGAWRGEGLGGTCDEVWLPAAGGSLIGTFRLVKGGELVFSELLSIARDSGSLVMKVKHFDPDLTAWEEKTDAVEFHLVELGAREAYFSGLTIRRVTPDRLEVFVAMKQRDGTLREEAFDLRRVEH